MMRAIANWEEVPIFDSEEAEADFWAENKPDLRLMEAAVAAAPRPRNRSPSRCGLIRGCWRASSGWPGRAI